MWGKHKIIKCRPEGDFDCYCISYIWIWKL